ncbi:MAG: hypothetical protein ABSC17_11480 [Thermacetogeniaceae bacterium]
MFSDNVAEYLTKRSASLKACRNAFVEIVSDINASLKEKESEIEAEDEKQLEIESLNNEVLGARYEDKSITITISNLEQELGPAFNNATTETFKNHMELIIKKQLGLK